MMVRHRRGLRIRTKCQTTEEFVGWFHRFCDETSIFIATPTPRGEGLETAFSIDFALGQPVLAGEGVVLQSWTTSDNRYGQPGMQIGVRILTKPSERVFERLLVARAVALDAASPSREVLQQSWEDGTQVGMPVFDEATQADGAATSPEASLAAQTTKKTMLGIPVILMPQAAKEPCASRPAVSGVIKGQQHESVTEILPRKLAPGVKPVESSATPTKPEEPKSSRIAARSRASTETMKPPMRRRTPEAVAVDTRRFPLEPPRVSVRPHIPAQPVPAIALEPDARPSEPTFEAMPETSQPETPQLERPVQLPTPPSSRVPRIATALGSGSVAHMPARTPSTVRPVPSAAAESDAARPIHETNTFARGTIDPTSRSLHGRTEPAPSAGLPIIDVLGNEVAAAASVRRNPCTSPLLARPTNERPRARSRRMVAIAVMCVCGFAAFVVLRFGDDEPTVPPAAATVKLTPTPAAATTAPEHKPIASAPATPTVPEPIAWMTPIVAESAMPMASQQAAPWAAPEPTPLSNKKRTHAVKRNATKAAKKSAMHRVTNKPAPERATKLRRKASVIACSGLDCL